MFNPSRPRENANAQAASTDGRAALYANGQAHMFERKTIIKKQRGVLNIKKKNLFFLFLPITVFECGWMRLQSYLVARVACDGDLWSV